MGNEQVRSKAQILQNPCKVKCAQMEISFYSLKKMNIFLLVPPMTLIFQFFSQLSILDNYTEAKNAFELYVRGSVVPWAKRKVQEESIGMTEQIN